MPKPLVDVDRRFRCDILKEVREYLFTHEGCHPAPVVPRLDRGSSHLVCARTGNTLSGAV